MKIIVFVLVCVSMAVAAPVEDEKRMLFDINTLIHSRYFNYATSLQDSRCLIHVQPYFNGSNTFYPKVLKYWDT